MGILDPETPDRFALYAESSFTSQRPVTAIHLASHARAANWLLRRPVRWFEIGGYRDLLPVVGSPTNGGQGRIVFPGRQSLFGRMMVPKMPGYTQARLRVHVRIPSGAGSTYSIALQCTTGRQPEFTEVYPVTTTGWREIVVPVSDGTAEWIDLAITGNSRKTMDVAAGGYGVSTAQDFEVRQEALLSLANGTTRGVYSAADMLIVSRTGGGSLVQSWVTGLVAAGGHQVVFYKSYTGQVYGSRAVRSNVPTDTSSIQTVTFDRPLDEGLLANLDAGQPNTRCAVYELPRYELGGVWALLQREGES